MALALFLAGLTGGFLHCATMCGPFVLAQLPGDDGRPHRLARLSGGALLPYHFGRLTTYTILGAGSGALGRLIVHATAMRGLLGVLLAFAAILFLLQAFARIGLALPGASSGAGRFVGRGIAALAAPLLRRPHGGRGYALGLALGFLPCGFLYAALAAAAGMGSAPAGALAMAAFAVGTVPSLAAIGILGAAATGRLRGMAPFIGVPVLLFNAVILGRMAFDALALSASPLM